MMRRTLLAAGLAAGVALLPGKRHAVADQKVLWVWAHPDDEIIAAGLALRQHLEAGRDCYVLSCTRGTGSGVRAQLNGTGVNATWGMPHLPAAEGYATLSPDDFGAARYAETLDALAVLASGTGRTVTTLEANLVDGAVTKADVMAAIADVYVGICSPGETLWLKTHTDIRTTGGGPLEHPDHTAVADACRQLASDRPELSNLRMYVEPEKWASTVVTGRVPAVFHTLPVAGTYQAASTLAAYEAFRAWAPGAKRFAIGHQSVASLFIAAPENRYHT